MQFQAIARPGDTVVLVHGLLGFKTLPGLSYFRGFKKALENRGYQVAHPTLLPLGLYRERAAELSEYCARAKVYEQAENRNARVHFLGHSQGGMDIRYMLSPSGLNQRHPSVGSVTTLASPHGGIARIGVLATLVAPLVHSLSGQLLAERGTLLHPEVMNFLQRVHSVPQTKLHSIIEQFGEQVDWKDCPSVEYCSFSARGYPGDGKLSGLMYAPWLLAYLNGGPNDGIVTVDCGKYGQWLGTLNQPHEKVVGLTWKLKSLARLLRGQRRPTPESLDMDGEEGASKERRNALISSAHEHLKNAHFAEGWIGTLEQLPRSHSQRTPELLTAIWAHNLQGYVKQCPY